MGDESDKLVTIDVDPSSNAYGKVVNYVSVGGRGEAHHMGFTDDRKYVWTGRLDDNKIFVFDVGTDPSKPPMACGMCHVERQAFTSNQLATSVGMEGKSVRRNAPSLFNVAYETKLFRDGRENSLETQVWSPILSPDEMAAPSVGWELAKVRSLPDYPALLSGHFLAAAFLWKRSGLPLPPTSGLCCSRTRLSTAGATAAKRAPCRNKRS